MKKHWIERWLEQVDMNDRDDTIHDIPWISVIERLEVVENRLEEVEMELEAVQIEPKLDLSWKALLAFLMVCSTAVVIVVLVWGSHG